MTPREVVDAQAEDEGLWFDATTAPEAYLQQELRRLHAAVEASDRFGAFTDRERALLAMGLASAPALLAVGGAPPKDVARAVLDSQPMMDELAASFEMGQLDPELLARVRERFGR